MHASDNPITEEVLTQNPLLSFMLVLVFCVFMLALVGSLGCWIFVIARRSRGQEILPLTLPWQPRKWALIEVLGIGIGALFLSNVVALAVAITLGITREDDEVPLELAAAGGLTFVLAVGLGAVWICTRYAVTLAHVGFDKLSPKTVLVGVIAACISLPGMYLIMILASAFSQSKYQHPLIESAIDNATLVSYLLAVFSAGIAAPIAEEFFFRVILQGWLQSIPFKSTVENLVGFSETKISEGAAIAPGARASRPLTNSTLASIYEPSIYEPSIVHVSTPLEAQPTSPVTTQPIPPLWPCIATGILFGLAHFDYGVSFIPLSFLGIFLGWLYRQTHSIWPCIIVHMMLNCTSMLMLGLLIVMKQAGIDIGR